MVNTYATLNTQTDRQTDTHTHAHTHTHTYTLQAHTSTPHQQLKLTDAPHSRHLDNSTTLLMVPDSQSNGAENDSG